MNVIGRFRSNHFVVKDQAAFAQWCQKYGLHLLVSESHPALVGFLNDKNEAGIPSTVFEEEDGEESSREIDFIGELGTFLADEHVAVVVELVYEGYRSLDGAAYAINNRGERRRIDLADILALAKTLGEHVTRF